MHLNLEQTGLITGALKYIVALLRRSQALRVIHLCGNPGLYHNDGSVNDELLEWCKLRIKAKPKMK